VYIGPSAFSRWTYDLTIQPGSDISTMDNEVMLNDLIPNTVYFITILPRGLRNNDDSLISAWLVQTIDQGQYVFLCVLFLCVLCMCVVCCKFLEDNLIVTNFRGKGINSFVKVMISVNKTKCTYFLHLSVYSVL